MGGDLNIVGCGRAGRTLARLFQDAGVFRVQGVLTRSLKSAREATSAVGAGSPLAGFLQFQAAPAWMIATPDDAIGSTARELVAAGRLRDGDVVFHLSGALSSAELEVCQRVGAHVASVHPLQNFIGATLSSEQFAGTWCAVEGDSEAVAVLSDALEMIGGRPVAISSQQKTLYHAGAVMSCNYFIALLDISLDLLDRAGIAREQGTELLAPILRKTLENALRHGPQDAMTGPISRGDLGVLARHIEELERVGPQVLEIYRSLGRATLTLVERREVLSEEVVGKMRRLLDDS